jgi:hypothetical protein
VEYVDPFDTLESGRPLVNEPNTIALVSQQVIASLRVLTDRTAQVCAVTSIVMAIISIAIAPDADPGAGTWFALLGIGALAMLAIITYVASRSGQASPPDRQHRLTAAVTFGVIALIANLFFGFWSTVLLGLGLFVLIRQARALRPGAFPWLMCATIVTLIPWWLWTALDTWDAGLLILLPLAALAWLTGEHIREVYAPPPAEDRLLSVRAHRYGAWMGMLLGGILIIVAGLIGNSSHEWLALGGMAMAFGVAIEAGTPDSTTHPGRTSAAISDLSFVIAAICWLTSII